MLTLPKKSDLRWYIILAMFLLLVLYVQYLSKNGYIPVTDIFIPDSYTYELRALEDRRLDFSAHTYNVFNKFIYSRSPKLFLVFNTLLLFLSVWFCKFVFGIISNESVHFARFAIVTNLYLLIAAVGPNKEIILLFVNLLFWFVFLSDYRILSKYSLIRNILLFLIASLPLLIRPYSSFPLYIVLLVKDTKFYKPRKIIIMFLLLFFMLNSFEFFGDIYSERLEAGISSFSDSKIFDLLSLLNAYSKDPILQYPAFAIKFIILMFGAVLRPFPIFSDPFQLLNFGYSLIAFLSFPANLALFILLIRNRFLKVEKKSYANIHDRNPEVSKILLFTVFSFIVIAINPVITFRYAFPFGAFVFALIPLQKKKMFQNIILFSVTLVSLLILFRSTDGSIQEFMVIPEFMNWL